MDGFFGAAQGIGEGRLDITLSVLSAMVTPVVLISACGTLLISTGNRLGRAIDRTRKVSEQYAALSTSPRAEDVEWEEQLTSYYLQLAHAARRTRLLHASLASLYAAQALFVATSVSLGVVALTSQSYAWVALVLGMTGVGLLFQAILGLIGEMRINRQALSLELDHIVTMSERHAPPGLLQRTREKVRA